MKTPHLISLAALVLLAAPGCNKRATEAADKIAELERKAEAAMDRQRDLEQELEDRKLAGERDSIERERARIEEDRAELERQQGEAVAAEDEELRKREEALSHREGKLEQFQSALEEKEDDLHEKTIQLSDRDRELAGREALPFEQTEQREPVGDYGMFYDSLASYGSWFDSPDYGYVWQPVVVRDANWRPYSRGRWACSDRGWTWISEEPFGWATYHYGRWTLLRDRGWIWVPGADWAPCWVSWRENDNHIGWAPLPPETLAYRGHNWDSSVDVQFGIAASCYNFVETRHFGSPSYLHCLPVSGNGGYFQQTTNITYIHIENRQIICGGPKYKKICDRIRKPLPFYRLEIDSNSRPGRDAIGMRPRIKGDHLLICAPNLDSAWNESLKPGRVKGRMEEVTVERNGSLSREVSDRYRRSREEGRQKADESVVRLGGPEKFDQRREEILQVKRPPVESKVRREEVRDLTQAPDRPVREISSNDETPERVVRRPATPGITPAIPDSPQAPAVRTPPRVAPIKDEKQADAKPFRQTPDGPRVIRRDEPAKRDDPPKREPEAARRDPQTPQPDDAVNRKREEQVREKQKQDRQQEAELARQAQQEAIQRKQDEQDREAIKQQREQERAQRQQQQEAQQREQQRAQRQQQEEQQREMQRQQERAQQREQEESRQRQLDQARERQEENRRQEERGRERQQEESRQRQQEENQRQRQQEESRQKREKDQKDQDDQRKRK